MSAIRPTPERPLILGTERPLILGTERPLILGIVALGILLRIAFFAIFTVSTAGGEAEAVAIAIANGRGFADAFYVGSGPTAHLTPTTPVLAGLVYRWFGVQSDASHIILMGWAFACFAVSALLLNRLFRRLGAPLPARAIGLCVMCFAPVFIVPETMVFRFWEGQLTFALLLFGLDHALAQREAGPSLRGSAVAMVALAALILLNPVFGLISGIAYGLAMLGRRSVLRLAAEFALLLCLVAPPVALWTARNQAVIGAPVLLRDNLGLELSFKANDEVLRQGPNPEIVTIMFNDLHPDGNGHGAARIREIGEHAYKVEIQRQVMEWIGAHPGGFAWIALQGWGQFYFPSPLYFPAETAAVQALMIRAVDAAGLATISVLAWRRRPGWLLLGLVVLLIGAAYAPFVYLWRYQYAAYNLLLFSAAYGGWLLMRGRARSFGKEKSVG